MTESALTSRAYQYAQKKKRVSESVIEAFKDGFNEGERSIINKTSKELLEVILKKYRSHDIIERDLAYGDVRRGLNESELKEAKNHNMILKTMKDLDL